jgi:hypothetical protein
VRVCEREREREGGREGGRDRVRMREREREKSVGVREGEGRGQRSAVRKVVGHTSGNVSLHALAGLARHALYAANRSTHSSTECANVDAQISVLRKKSVGSLRCSANGLAAAEA